MDTTMTQTGILVGIDGSEASSAALRWAETEAQRRGAALHVVLAYDVQWPPVQPQQIDELETIAHEQAQSIVDETLKQITDRCPDLPVHGEATSGLPAQTLIELSRQAELVVVGSRGLGGFGSLLLGSVSDQVATHAHAPVVVVRGRTETGVGPVVVGVDGSPGAEYALGVAFDEAERRGCALTAVTAYSRPLSAPGIGVPPLVYDRDKLVNDLKSYLTGAVAGWQVKHPDVAVEIQVVSGQAAHILAQASTQARLVVVGTRGHGGFERLPLGSVGRQLLHHADCPVMIARP
jgi:nucleotide-binding universal stress UspA family protein